MYVLCFMSRLIQSLKMLSTMAPPGHEVTDCKKVYRVSQLNGRLNNKLPQNWIISRKTYMIGLSEAQARSYCMYYLHNFYNDIIRANFKNWFLKSHIWHGNGRNLLLLRTFLYLPKLSNTYFKDLRNIFILVE